MGVVLSVGEISPLALISTVIGFVSFAFTLLTFFNVFWASLGTFYAARHEMNDHLSSLKQGLLEERRHLRAMRKRAERDSQKENDGSRIRARSTSVPGPGGRAGSRKRRESRGRRGWKGSVRYPAGTLPLHLERDTNSINSSGEAISMSVMRHIVRDMIREFRALEYPFLKPEYQSQDLTHWGSHTHSHSRHHNPLHKQNHNYAVDYEKSPYYNSHYTANSDDEDAVLYRNTRFGNEYRDIGVFERWKWINTKKNVVKLNESLNRIEIRRTAHEVGEVLSSVYDMGRDLEEVRGSVVGLEGRLNRVNIVGVGVRKEGT